MTPTTIQPLIRLLLLAALITPAMALDVNAARTQIMNGVSNLYDPGSPGRVAVWGANACVIAKDGNGGAVVGAAEYGSGRAVILNDQQWLEMEREAGTTTGLFYTNTIAWLSTTTAKNINIVTYRAANTTWLQSQGYTNVVTTTQANLISDLSTADVFIGFIEWNQPAANITALQNFVSNGGGLFLCEFGQGSVWWDFLWDPDVTQICGNLVVNVMGLGFPTDTGANWNLVPATDAVVTAALVQDMLDNPGTYTQAEVDYAARQMSFALQFVDTGEAEVLAYDTMYQANISSINPTPSTPVTDSMEKAFLEREADILETTAPAEVTAHRTAEDVYGMIAPATPRVTRVVTIDTSRARWRPTGLYAAPGELVSVTVPAALVGNGYKIRINPHISVIGSARSSWERPPSVHRSFPIDATSVDIANAFGGAIFIDLGGNNAYATPPNIGDQSLTIAGAIEHPYFRIGTHTDQQWIDTIRDTPAPYTVLETANYIIHVPSSKCTTLTQPTALMNWWNNIVSMQDDLAARLEPRTSAELMNIDTQISHGFAHAGYPYQCSFNWHNPTDYPDLVQNGFWGDFHELGHNQQRDWWTLRSNPNDTEITVNIFSNRCLESVEGTYGDPGFDAGWGWSVDPVAVMSRVKSDVAVGGSYASKSNRWSFWFQLADGFGWDA